LSYYNIAVTYSALEDYSNAESTIVKAIEIYKRIPHFGDNLKDSQDILHSIIKKKASNRKN
jgi:hypothetical protein